MDVIVVTGNQAYILEYEHKNGWNAEMFKERYSEVLERYDYIVGDWGYNQLRLRGFYQEGHPRATKDTVISSLVDYLNEYCNFGCAYFVLRKTDVKSAPADLTDAGLPAGAIAGEAAQTAETAAAAAAASPNGMLMRWPLKERHGGPVRMPGAAAVARAAAEAEKRQHQAQQQSDGRGRSSDGRQSQGASGASEYGYGGKQGHRGAGGGGERRSYGNGHQGGQADNRSGGRPGSGNRGPRPHSHHAERSGGGGGPAKSGGNWRQSPDANRTASDPVRASDAGSPGPKAEGAKNGSRWPGKNRRKGRFGGKPNRPDTAPREDGGTGTGSGSGRQAGE